MGYTTLTDELPVTQAYDGESDVVLFDAQGDFIEVSAGQFIIFGPQDVHAPGIVAGSPPVPAETLKIVVKVAIA
jgi:YhcH/YjgK/YiaL family protein